MSVPAKLNTKDRLLDAAKRLFAERGFAGASVRDICTEADAGRNLIHHYFGSKEGLYQAILTEFSENTFDVQLRVIAGIPQSAEEMRFKFTHFITETLEALVGQQLVFQILSRDPDNSMDLTIFKEGLVTFLRQCRGAGYLASDFAIDMVPGLLLDRLGNQVLYALSNRASGGENILTDEIYRRDWALANANLFLFGLSDRD